MNNEKQQILIADDDQDLLNLLSARCKHFGLDVIEASDAMDALANADFYAPAIALLDVRMPGGNGVSVAEMMATDDRLKSTSVIVMTGDPNDTIRQRCEEMGARLVKKDQQIWTHLEPMIVDLLNSGDHPNAESLSDLYDAAEGNDPAKEESVLSLLKDWGWLENVETHNDQEESSADDETPWVLAIDDDPDFAVGLQHRLLSVGVQLVRAYRGMDGYRSAFRGRPAAILLDYHMPDGNGEYILRRLQESPATDTVPVIVVTGMADAPLKRRMLAGGASEFLAKPVTWKQIADAIRQYTDLDLRSTLIPSEPALTV